MSFLHHSHIEAIAPDEGVLSRAKALASPRKWQMLAKNETSIWGKCKGSQTNIYQSQASLTPFQSSCNCPSRLRPCKHVVSLLWLFVSDPAIFESSDTPTWVKQHPRPTKTSVEKQPDPHSKQLRAEARMNNIMSGAKELNRWLSDAIRHGTAELFQEDEDYWDHWRARMVDAQAPGLAGRVEQIRELFRREDWPEQTLDALGELYLLLQGIAKLPELSPALQAELITQVGISTKKAEVLVQPGIQDHWLVVGRTVDMGDRIDVARTWLYGQRSNKIALFLDFAVGQRSFTHIWTVGTNLNAEMVFYPGSYPMRAEFKTAPETSEHTAPLHPISNSWSDSLHGYAEALGQNPFLSQYPILMEHLTPCQHQDQWGLIDQHHQWVPFRNSFSKRWELISLSGGNPLTLFGEWSGKAFLPLGIVYNNRWIGL
ncbi:MAG: hypothetical protein AAF587_43500 [Bacteroidota bacterium]